MAARSVKRPSSKTKRRKRETHEKGNQNGSHQIRSTNRRFELHERICEVAVCVLTVAIAVNWFFQNKVAFVWSAATTICAGLLAFCFWFTDYSMRVKARTRTRTSVDSVADKISSLDSLREEGRKLQKVFGAPTGHLPDDEPNRWLEKVQVFLRSISRSHGEHFDEIMEDPRRYTGPAGLSPGFNQEDMTHWMNDDPRRQQQWPRITAVLNYLDQVRDELYKQL